MDKWLSYDQISLIPIHQSTLDHRAEANTSVQFGPVKLEVPIIAAPMPDVSNGEMADKLMSLGSLGFIHRFQTRYAQEQELRKSAVPEKIGIAISAKPDEAHVSVDFFYQLGVRIFCLDTANGYSLGVQRTIERLKNNYPDIFIVTGNVASWQAFRELESWGADAIRVGIAGGSVCETRTETGVYSPMASAVLECAQRGHQTIYGPKEKEPNHALLVADGGISSPGSMCKALALGADLVMMGGALAGTSESPGDVILIDGKKHKYLRGAASYSTQKENGNEDPEYIEGRETPVPFRGSVKGVIDRYAAGLRSSMSYHNARTLEEYRKNVKVVEIESHRA